MTWWTPWSVVAFVAVVPFGPACSSDEPSDDDSASGGSGARGSGGASGVSGSAAGGTAGASGSATGGAGGTGGALVDCAGLCNRVRTICEGQSTIDDTWVDVCTRACEIRVEVAPDTALLEKSCIDAAADCTTAVLCVASPSGSGGSGG